MKKISIFLMMMLLITVMTGCNNTKKVENKVDVYYINYNKELVKEERIIEVEEETDLIALTLKELQKKSKVEGNKRLFDMGVKIVDNEVSIKGVTLNINLEKKFYELENVEQILFRNGLAKTFTQFYFIDEVKFLVENEDMVDSNGEIVPPIKSEEIITTLEERGSEKKKTTIVLYFTNKDGEGLFKEERSVIVSDETSIEEIIIQELMKGSKSEDRFSTITNGAELLDIEVKDEICYVDFSKSFRDNHTGGSTGEMLTLYAIINSLTELENISKVQFLIEGENLELFKGHYEFDKPFERDESMIK